MSNYEPVAEHKRSIGRTAITFQAEAMRVQLTDNSTTSAEGPSTGNGLGGAICFTPPPRVRHRCLVSEGVTAECIAMTGQEPFESHYCGPLHLLIAHERLARRSGVTNVEGLPDSSMRNLSHTLTFVPAGRRFREWHDPDIPSCAIYIHIDPQTLPLTAEERAAPQLLTPRLHFHSSILWQTVLKLKTLVEDGGAECTRYGEALAGVLAHELLRSDMRAISPATETRGGLASWQRRLVALYVEDHLAEEIPVVTLAALARLSPSHFSHSFKHSFGVSPHRYHVIRRIERAKVLLADSGASITRIGQDLGFQESSAFTKTFRRLLGCPPSAYRRSHKPSSAEAS